jgi:hypothetical protein
LNERKKRTRVRFVFPEYYNSFSLESRRATQFGLNMLLFRNVPPPESITRFAK